MLFAIKYQRFYGSTTFFVEILFVGQAIGSKSKHFLTFLNRQKNSYKGHLNWSIINEIQRYYLSSVWLIRLNSIQQLQNS